MCKDDALRRKVLATFPPISSSGCLGHSDITESLSLYSKSKASNSWSSSSSQCTQPLMKIRRRSTHSLITPRLDGGRATTDDAPRLTRSRSTIGLDGKGKKSANNIEGQVVVPPTRERRTSKERRESSTTASSSLPKVVEEETQYKPAPVEPRKHIQRELTVIIKYEGGECTQETFNGRRSSSLKLPGTEECQSERIGFLALAKSKSILQWLEKCDFTGYDDVDPTDTHLPALVSKDTDTDT